MNSWASGALDPDGGASGDLVTSVKRFVHISSNQRSSFDVLFICTW